MADTGRIFIEPNIIMVETKLAKVIASIAIKLRASLELATIRAGDFGAGGDNRSSGRVVSRTAGCEVEGGRGGSYPQHISNYINYREINSLREAGTENHQNLVFSIFFNEFS